LGPVVAMFYIMTNLAMRLGLSLSYMVGGFFGFGIGLLSTLYVLAFNPISRRLILYPFLALS
jgi:hypothetical protein